jgi:hypothetical protein
MLVNFQEVKVSNNECNAVISKCVGVKDRPVRQPVLKEKGRPKGQPLFVFIN